MESVHVKSDETLYVEPVKDETRSRFTWEVQKTCLTSDKQETIPLVVLPSSWHSFQKQEIQFKMEVDLLTDTEDPSTSTDAAFKSEQTHDDDSVSTLSSLDAVEFLDAWWWSENDDDSSYYFQVASTDGSLDYSSSQACRGDKNQIDVENEERYFTEGFIDVGDFPRVS